MRRDVVPGLLTAGWFPATAGRGSVRWWVVVEYRAYPVRGTVVRMDRIRRTLTSLPQTLALAAQGVRTWGRRRILVATGVALAFGLLLGLATVLIPNPVFTREIPPVWWNFPVWILTSVLSGMVVATYVREDRGAAASTSGGLRAVGYDDDDAAQARHSSRIGVAGAFLAWFAVGCPVCNKLALLALGYSGAITWFAPVQPFLAIIALALTAVALVVRLRGQVACVLPTTRARSAPSAR